MEPTATQSIILSFFEAHPSSARHRPALKRDDRRRRAAMSGPTPEVLDGDKLRDLVRIASLRDLGARRM
jgi:hypothetical protein